VNLPRRTDPLRRRLTAWALALLSALSAPSWASPPPWGDSAYTYFANRVPLSQVLREFAAGFSLSVSLPEGLNNTVNGRFTVRNPSEFLDRLLGVYGLTWYTHAGVLHVSRLQETVVRTISIPTVGGSNNVRQVLTDLQVFEPKYGWSEIPDQGIAVVSGPRTYAELIERTIAALPRAPGGQQVVMYRLRYASVDDRTVAYRDREIIVPGVATVLRNLFQQNVAGTVRASVAGPNSGMRADAAAGSGPSNAASSGTGVGLSVGATGAAPPAAGNPGGGGASGAGSNAFASPSGLMSTQGRPRPNIQSDPRLNAIIVQDAPDRIPLYTSLIAQMDVPAPLIEIEALIVDVNTTKLAELGISWGVRGSGGSTAAGFGNVNSAPDPNTISIITGNAGVATPTTAILDGASRYLVARLRALEQQGDASIQARPSILTTENIGAVIDLSETVYIQTTSERTALVTPVTAGTTLRVTPRLSNRSGAEAVFLTVDIEDGQVQSGVSGVLPTVRKGVVSTEASLGIDESLLIGGYNSLQTVVGRSKVPLLGDIPLIGSLFATNSNSTQRRERLFLIKSRVVARVQEVQASDNLPPTTKVFPAAPAVVLIGDGAGSLTGANAMPGAGSGAGTFASGPAVMTPDRMAGASSGSAAPSGAAEAPSGAASARETSPAASPAKADPANARRALQTTLAAEQRTLQQLRKEASTNGSSSELRRKIARTQANIQALKKELAKTAQASTPGAPLASVVARAQ
jgi:type III secretion protein C